MDLGLSVSLISAILNGLMGFYLVRAGKSSHSPALVADGKHLTLDAYNGVLIVAAIALTLFTDWIWVDGVASILFALLMCWQGIRLIREAVAALMDETNPAVFNKVIDWIMQHQKPTWIDLHNLRIQQYGGDLHIDCHLTLPRYWDLNRVHDEIHDFEVTMAEVFPTEIEIFVHVDPCLDACCSHCEILDCAIRSQAFTNKIEWNAKNMALNQKHFNEL
jgi:cation diffusion facilitator family transporter